MNIPRHDTHDGRQVVITTADFRRGQAAAWVDFGKDPDATPNRDALARVSPEFAAGYCDEWETFCVPARALQRQREREDLARAKSKLPICGRCGETAHPGLCWYDPR